MAQSSIEWLIEYLTNESSILISAHYDAFEQAKAMHEEEIMEAHYADRYGCFSKDYYNETFNSNEMSGESEFIQINQDNPVTKGSTNLIRNPQYQQK